MAQHASLHTFEIEAFCQTCPALEELTRLLHPLGFRLVFQMDAVIYPAYTQTPDLPAQYHYKDEHGTEVIFLAGKGHPLDGEYIPPHASRFWLCAGAHPMIIQNVAQFLATTWAISWRYASDKGIAPRLAII